jgi:hypothetical protein
MYIPELNPKHWLPNASVNTRATRRNVLADAPSLCVGEKGIGYPNTYATAEEADKNPGAFQLNCGKSCPHRGATGPRNKCTHGEAGLNPLTVSRCYI